MRQSACKVCGADISERRYNSRFCLKCRKNHALEYARRYQKNNLDRCARKQAEWNRLHPERAAKIRNKTQFRAVLISRIQNAHLNLESHLYFAAFQSENSSHYKSREGNCVTCAVRQSKIDCLERLYELNFVERELLKEKIALPACVVNLATRVVRDA